MAQPTTKPPTTDADPQPSQAASTIKLLNIFKSLKAKLVNHKWKQSENKVVKELLDGLDEAQRSLAILNAKKLDKIYSQLPSTPDDVHHGGSAQGPYAAAAFKALSQQVQFLVPREKLRLLLTHGPSFDASSTALISLFNKHLPDGHSITELSKVFTVFNPSQSSKPRTGLTPRSGHLSPAWG